MQYMALQNNTDSDRNSSTANNNNLGKRKETDVLLFISSEHK